MNIALVIFHADPSRGGAERYTVDLARSLARLGHEVTLLASAFADVPEGVKAVALDTDAMGRTARYVRFLDSLDLHLAGRRYDIVHAMLPVRQCDVYHPHAGIAAESMRAGHLRHRDPVRRVLAMVGTKLNRKRRRFAWVERRLLNSESPPVVLCLSDYVRSAVRRHYALPDGRLFPLFNGVDLDRFDPEKAAPRVAAMRARWNLAAGRVAALLMAQDFERKGLAQAIQALRSLDGTVSLVVVGRDRTGPYRKLAQDLGVGPRVVFAGASDDPAACYAAADFFVLPTRHDPCSLVVLEALAMGLPVISTAQNGACEIMTRGREGFVLDDPGDVAALAGAMKAMLDAERRREMSRACLALRPKLSQEAHVRRLLQAYRQAAHVHP